MEGYAKKKNPITVSSNEVSDLIWCAEYWKVFLSGILLTAANIDGVTGEYRVCYFQNMLVPFEKFCIIFEPFDKRQNINYLYSTGIAH